MNAELINKDKKNKHTSYISGENIPPPPPPEPRGERGQRRLTLFSMQLALPRSVHDLRREKEGLLTVYPL